MNALQLKNSIIQKLTQIDDVNTLRKINDLIQSYNVISHERATFLSDNKTDENNNAEDFTNYIKEWVKDM